MCCTLLSPTVDVSAIVGGSGPEVEHLELSRTSVREDIADLPTWHTKLSDFDHDLTLRTRGK
jgi:hypothetical protein